jgi:hypothetical protein
MSEEQLSQSTSAGTVDVGAKVAILHTIADSMYASTARRIREAAANALDNGATWFLVWWDPEERTLSLCDNGRGISEGRFQEIWTSLGYGSGRSDMAKLSYFGLGFMSIFRLGTRASIFTKVASSSEPLVLEVDTETVFDPAIADQPLSSLSQYMHLHKDGSMRRRQHPAPSVDSLMERLSHDGAPPPSWTEIVIEGLSEAVTSDLGKREFIEELQKLLPLTVQKEDPFLSRVSDVEQRRALMELLSDPTYCPTLSTFFGTEGGEPEPQYKYFPRFRSDLQFDSTDLQVGYSQNRDFAYYLIEKTEELQDASQRGAERSRDPSETGFWVRNRNFLVKGADFFGARGHRHIIHEPLQGWLFCEILHRDMRGLVTVARDDYLWDSQAFRAFLAEVKSLAEEQNKLLRSAWAQKQAVTSAFVDPVVSFDATSTSPLGRVQAKLEAMLPDRCSDPGFTSDVLQKFEEARDPAIEKPAHEITRLLGTSGQPVRLADRSDLLVEVSTQLPNGKPFEFSFDRSSKKATLTIAGQIFNSRKVVFLGKSFELRFMYASESNSGVSIDTAGRVIYVNPFNSQLARLSLSALDVYLIIEVADALSKTKAEMKQFMLAILREKPAHSPAALLVPFADELSRRAAW